MRPADREFVATMAKRIRSARAQGAYFGNPHEYGALIRACRNALATTIARAARFDLIDARTPIAERALRAGISHRALALWRQRRAALDEAENPYPSTTR